MSGRARGGSGKRAAVAAEARRRGRPDGKTSERGKDRRPAAVTPVQEGLVLAAFESGLKPAAIAREFPHCLMRAGRSTASSAGGLEG